MTLGFIFQLVLRMENFKFTAPLNSQWRRPCGLRRRTAAVRLLGLWVQITLRAWRFVVPCVGSGLCCWPITLSEESWRACVCVRARARVSECVCVRVSLRACVHACVCLPVCVCACVGVCVSAPARVCFCVCVRSRNLTNEAALVRVGLLSHRTKKKLLKVFTMYRCTKAGSMWRMKGPYNAPRLILRS